MNAWDTYKKFFNVWENATAQYLETVLKSPLVLEPAGAWLSAAMKTKSASDKDRKSTRLNSSHSDRSRMPSSA